MLNYQRVPLNDVERCWSMLKHVTGSHRAWQFAPAVPKHRWSNQQSGLKIDLNISRIVGWCHKILRRDFFQNPFLVVPNSCTWSLENLRCCWVQWSNTTVDMQWIWNIWNIYWIIYSEHLLNLLWFIMISEHLLNYQLILILWFIMISDIMISIQPIMILVNLLVN